jgi:hypothetical protein
MHVFLFWLNERCGHFALGKAGPSLQHNKTLVEQHPSADPTGDNRPVPKTKDADVTLCRHTKPLSLLLAQFP